MKTRNVIIFFVVFVALIQCKKEPEEPYSNENIVRDNAQAALYFHTIFREAEHAWAFINDLKYEPGTYADPANKPAAFKNYTFNDNDKDVTISYNAWVTNNLLLMGTIRVKFELNSYRVPDRAANVYLADFSINGHNISGEPLLKYRAGDNDQYIYSLTAGLIREKGISMPALISGSITDGRYERIEGGDDPLSQDDNLWAYYGVMKGMLHDDPNLNYTNTVLNSFIMENGENGIVHFTMDANCKTAKKGVSRITIPGRPDIDMWYRCSEVDFESINNVR